MIYWQNRILTNVKNSLEGKCNTVVSAKNNIKASFPACLVQVVSNPAIAETLDLDDSECAVYCGVNLEIYSKVSMTETMELTGIANEAMYKMGFKRREGPSQVQNVDSPDIFRIVCRYVRVIGASETIDRF